MSLLALIRHGESEWNVERRIQGQSGTGLSPRGKEQAEHAARFIASRHPDALLASSDLQRCRETGAPFAAAYGREPVYDPGLRERDFGDWTGRLATEVAEADMDRWTRWRRGDDVIGDVGGEDSATLVQRVLDSIQGLIADAAGRPVVCITHGGPVWHGTRALLDVNGHVLGRVDNCSITEIAVDVPDGMTGDRTRRLVTWNQVAHLPAALQPVLPVSAPDVEDEPVGR